jgi:hypothetical protein
MVCGRSVSVLTISFATLAGTARAGVVQYGDADVLGTGYTYSGDPTAGATLQGLQPGVVTFASLITGHIYPPPPTPSPNDYPGTDQIYVGPNQTFQHDGYSQSPTRIAGPQVILLDYSALAAGQTVESLTLGIAADDFQNPVWHQPFVVTLNGVNFAPLTDTINGLNQTGPQTQFFSIGLPLSLVNSSHTLTLSINSSGDGGDGWAIDFLTVGVNGVPSPGSLPLIGFGSLTLLGRTRRRG